MIGGGPPWAGQALLSGRRLAPSGLASVPGRVIDLDAALISGVAEGGVVSTLPDRLGTSPAALATGGGATLVTIGGQKTLRFSGSSTDYRTTGIAGTVIQTWYALARWSPATSASVFGPAILGHPVNSSTESNLLRIQGDGAACAVMTGGFNHPVGGGVRINGVATNGFAPHTWLVIRSRRSATTGNGLYNPLVVGRDAPLNRPWRGELARLVGYSTVPTAEQEAAIEAELLALRGLLVAGS